MIYNVTDSGLDNSLWDPHFTLPTVVSTLRAVEKGTLMAHRYVREMFLNLMLSEEVRPICGVDVTNFHTE